MGRRVLNIIASPRFQKDKKMIITDRAIKFVITRTLFIASLIANIYALIAINEAETSLAGCESYIKQIETAQAQYVELFGEQE